MEYNSEQKAIIATDCDIKVNARAGTGKTTTLHGYVKNKPDFSRVLYIAYNKSVQEEAEKKFSDIYHCDIHVKTAHSLAFNKIMPKHNYKIDNLSIEKVGNALGLHDNVLISHVIGYLNVYLCSSHNMVEHCDYTNTLKENESITYVRENMKEIINLTERLYNMMDTGSFPITHDFYVKKWQLSKPRLDYDYILFDEGQDSSDVMLDVFNSQKAIKVIVGDTHQQIYAWRNAVNSLSKVSSKEFVLTTSFRFEENIAEMATKVIKWKEELLKDASVKDFVVYGKGKLGEIKTTGIIGRTNIALISQALNDMVNGVLDTKKACFEGELKSYSVYGLVDNINDLERLKIGENDNINNKELRDLHYDEVNKYAKETNNIQLLQAVELYETFGNNFQNMLNKLEKKLHKVRSECDIIYSTVHKSKGMEYDSVTLLNDFKCKSDLKKYFLDKTKNKVQIKSLVNEEINLLYVAITRSKGDINLPPNILKDLI